MIALPYCSILLQHKLTLGKKNVDWQGQRMSVEHARRCGCWNGLAAGSWRLAGSRTEDDLAEANGKQGIIIN
jgi:hypothetical protein